MVGRVRRLMARWTSAVSALALTAALSSTPAMAQDFGNGNGQLLLAADSLVYDFDGETVSAVGGVQISYDGTKLVAQKVTFNRKTGRMFASGNVEIVEADGNRIYADEFDVTDNFADGFITALRLETTENTRFAAARAERRDGNIAVFERGVYTACEPCADKPDKPLAWQVKAETIVWNQQRKTIRFEGARFQMFGFTLAALPSFEIADHTVKRKSGFLVPGAGYTSGLGYNVDIPYFWALAPNIDVLLKARAFTNQGVLLSGRFLHQLNNGSYSITAAGIRQADPSAFAAGTEDALHTDRGMIGSKGSFKINPRWTFGWDVLEQTDKNFSRRYGIEGYADTRRASEIYLTGLGNRNYFDLRASRFEVQEDVDTGEQERQAQVLPSLDYRNTLDAPVLGGEATLRLNARNISRELDDTHAVPSGTALRGLAGENLRVTAEAEWQRSFVAPGGLVLTPFAGLRADGFVTDYATGALAAEALARGVAQETRDSFFRSMATLGLDARWPVLLTTPGATHVIEPRIQLLARPDAEGQALLGVPNEDAQSLVFDAATLFEQDKFSGYDRVEGGVRANVGLRYSGTFDNGLRADALFGQSYHLSGDNPFAAPDLVFAGAYSGLETNVSDFVGSASLAYAMPAGTNSWLKSWSFGVGGRFDEQTFDVRRADATLALSGEATTLSARYSYIAAQPDYAFTADREELVGAISHKITENWTASAGATYNLSVDKVSAFNVGLNYADECFIYGLGYSESRNVITDARTQTIGFRISLRTLGELSNDFSLK